MCHIICRSALCAILVLSLHALPVDAASSSSVQNRDIHSVWERFMPKPAPTLKARMIGPGRVVGDLPELRKVAAEGDWEFRQKGYEIYFAARQDLARGIYGLAVDAGDVPADMHLARFEQGVSGFHYSLDQVCRWADKALRGEAAWSTPEERQFLDWLLIDGVIDIRNGKAVPAGRVTHVLGAAQGKKRDFTTNLVHERLHILWDEDVAFRLVAKARWNALSEREKEAVYASLPGYSREREELILEEWFVRESETMALEQRRQLVGM